MKLKHYLMLLLLLVIALFYFKVNPNSVNFLLKCPLYKSTGIYCPGCGSQRAFHNLLHGDLLSALKNNLMLVLGLFGLVYHYGIQFSNSILKTHFKSIFDHKKVIFLFIGILVFFWVLRNIPLYPFTILAPSI